MVGFVHWSTPCKQNMTDLTSNRWERALNSTGKVGEETNDG